jgi:hypothetical protein
MNRSNSRMENRTARPIRVAFNWPQFDNVQIVRLDTPSNFAAVGVSTSSGPGATDAALMQHLIVFDRQPRSVAATRTTNRTAAESAFVRLRLGANRKIYRENVAASAAPHRRADFLRNPV